MSVFRSGRKEAEVVALGHNDESDFWVVIGANGSACLRSQGGCENAIEHQ